MESSRKARDSPAGVTGRKVKRMDMRFFKNGELQDKKIMEALQKAAAWYEDGAIAEVRDLLADIVNAIDEFDNSQEG